MVSLSLSLSIYIYITLAKEQWELMIFFSYWGAMRAGDFLQSGWVLYVALQPGDMISLSTFLKTKLIRFLGS